MRSNSSGYPGHTRLDLRHCVHDGRISSHCRKLVEAAEVNREVIAKEQEEITRNSCTSYLDAPCLAVLAAPARLALQVVSIRLFVCLSNGRKHLHSKP
jgi:hypothetical protein